MYDWNKTEIKEPSILELLNNQNLVFNSPCLVPSYELHEYIRTASYNGIDKFITSKGESFIKTQFSFHKYWDIDDRNFSDFGISELTYVLEDLTYRFGYNPYTSILQNIEYGVNITLPFPVTDLLDSILLYKGKGYTNDDYGGKGYMIRFKFDQYEIKIYDKGKQYRLKENIIRFEIKVKKMHFIKSKKIVINCYSDLLNIATINLLKESLIKAFNALVFYDYSIEIDSLNIKIADKELLRNGNDPTYWKRLKENPNRCYKRKLKRFNDLVAEHGKSRMKEIMINLMKSKLEIITNIDKDTELNIVNYLSKFEQYRIPPINNSDFMLKKSVPK